MRFRVKIIVWMIMTLAGSLATLSCYASNQSGKEKNSCSKAQSHLDFKTNMTPLVIKTAVSNQSDKRFTELIFKSSDTNNKLIFKDIEYNPVRILLSLCTKNCGINGINYKMYASYDAYNHRNKNFFRVVVPIVEGERSHRELEKIIDLLKQHDKRMSKSPRNKTTDIEPVITINPGYFLPRQLSYCHIDHDQIAAYKVRVYYLAEPISISTSQYRSYYQWASDILDKQP